MVTADTRYTRAVARALRGPRRDLTGLLPYQDELAQLLNGDTAAGWPDTAVVIMPRQTGKTSTIFKALLGRGAHRRDYRAAYTAQRGTVVTERFTGDGDGWINTVEGSPLANHYRYVRRAGGERITNRATRSFVRGFPPVDGALRSLAFDCVVVDEGQEHDRDRGEALDSTIVPTFATRPLRQLIVTGTAGGPGWWRDYYERALAGEHALFELGTWPDDADPDDEQTWIDHHPGLRAGLTDLDALRGARKILGRDQFAREYGNRWDADTGAGAPIPLDRWDALPGDPDPAGRQVVAFDVTLDRSRADVARVTGRHLQLVAQCHPTDLPTVLDRLGPDTPVWAPPGQAGIVDDLRRRGYRADTLTGSDYRAGCQQLHDAVLAGDLTHDHQPELRAAWEVAARSWYGDTWALSARKSGGVIAPAVAAVVAWRAAAQYHEPVLA